MAVPSVYYNLGNYYEKKLDKEEVKRKLSKLRLLVSGSSALPEKEMLKWRSISGQDILERFGMTEIGMGLSNLYDERVPGKVGYPLPGVEAALLEIEKL
jgi:malonyl-CoA/methylmalonyl-CoA synthetase